MKIYGVKEEKISIGNRPAYLFTPDTDHKEIVVYYHGWSSSGASSRFRASIIASTGFSVLVPEADFHGERGNLDYEKPEIIMGNIFKIINHNLREFSDIKKYIDNLGMEQILITGHSMGAMTGAAIFSQCEDIFACAPINGTFSFQKAVDEYNIRHCDLKEAFKKHYNPFDIDPSKYIENLKNRHILLLNGEEDRVVSHLWDKNFIKNLKEINDKDNFKILRYPFVGHFVTTNMIEDLIRWAKEIMKIKR